MIMHTIKQPATEFWDSPLDKFVNRDKIGIFRVKLIATCDLSKNFGDRSKILAAVHIYSSRDEIKSLRCTREEISTGQQL